jgi:hypothetical protein
LTIETKVCFELDLTGDLQLSNPVLNQGQDYILHMCAEADGVILDLNEVDEIKIIAKHRYTSKQIIFEASLLNGKVVIVTPSKGLFDVVLTPSDTDFIGDAAIQILYHKTTGETFLTECSIVKFKKSFVVSDLLTPEDPEVENFTLCDCPINVQAGNLVYVSGAGEVDQAISSDPNKIDVVGWVFDKPTTTTCRVTNDIGIVPASGLTPGDRLYLSPIVPGGVTATVPITQVEVGVAKTADSYLFTGAKILI